jgi:hypothetical protein
LSTKKTRRITDAPGKVGTRSGVPALKKRTKRALRHSSKLAIGDLAIESDDRADAKLSDKTYRGMHPATAAETRVLTSKVKRKKKKKAPQVLTAAKKRAAEALQKELDKAAREKAQRRAKRRAAARALKEARKK